MRETHKQTPPTPVMRRTPVQFSLLFWDSRIREYNLQTDAIVFYEMSAQYHVDVLVHSTSYHSFGASSLSKKCVHVEKQPDDILTKYWIENVSIRVKDPDLAVKWLERACKAKTKFKINEYKFFIPQFVEEIIEKDEDCTVPETWKNLFCSKFVLLFLRYCHLTGNLDADEERLRKLWTVNSNQCTPAHLKRIVLHIFHYLQT